MKMEPIWDVKTHYALESVKEAAKAIDAARDTEAAREALTALRAASVRAYSIIIEAEAETRRAALERINA